MNPVPASPSRATSRTPAGIGRQEDRELAALARAIAHPARVAILRMLIERGDCVCGGIVDTLPLAQATVSQHLKVLKEAGLIRGEIEHPRVCYCADPDAVARLERLVNGLSHGR